MVHDTDIDNVDGNANAQDKHTADAHVKAQWYAADDGHG